MKLIRRDLLFSTFFNDIFEKEWLGEQHSIVDSVPALNIQEDGHGFNIEMAAPGMNKENSAG